VPGTWGRGGIFQRFHGLGGGRLARLVSPRIDGSLKASFLSFLAAKWRHRLQQPDANFGQDSK
jgi:hypothetical protein